MEGHLGGSHRTMAVMRRARGLVAASVALATGLVAVAAVGLVAWRTVGSSGPALAQPRDAGPAGAAGGRAPEEPVPSDLAGAEAALGRGSYVAAEQAFTKLARGRDTARARLGLARVRVATGRYDDAAAVAQQVAASSDLHADAETLRAEMLAARGRLDDAERVLAGLARDPRAHRARVVLGRLLLRRGRPSEAQPQLMALVQAYNDRAIGERDAAGLSYVGMAARGLASYQDANDAFQEAARADPQRVETQLEWAELFLEKYDAGHAEECVRDALRVNGRSARAHALMARIVLEQSFDFTKAQEELDLALSVDPSLVAAHVTRAGIALRDMDIAGADRHLDRALAVDPNDLEALSVRAAVRFLADDAAGFTRAKAEVLRRNPRFSRMYSIIAEYADWEHRYPEIVAMAREAVRLDPEDAFAYATLGLNLLRMGDEQNGLPALQQSWRRDRFNVHVFNTLNLYDDVITQEYVDFPSAPFVFRMHREEKPVLERYAPARLGRAWADMVRRYRFTPEGPVRIEMYASAAHFSVRTTGLPNVGVQGVCFGKVVTALSPRGGPFNWAQITSHELAHVFHIQLSRNHVPRWFTEGLAEHETVMARPEWRREDDSSLYRALAGGRLPALVDLNSAFTHARSGDDILVAYYASSRLVGYIVERFGFPKIPEMLRAWGAGRRTPEVIRTVLGIEPADLDRAFRERELRRLAARARDFSIDFAQYRDIDALRRAAAVASPSADALAGLAAGLVRAGQAEEALRTAERAIRISARQPVAQFLLASAALAHGNAAEADVHLRDLAAGGVDGYEVRLLAARIALRRNDARAARAALEAATRIDGERPEAWQGLAEVAEHAHDANAELDVLQRLVRIDQHDRESMGKLLDLLWARSRWAEIVALGEQISDVDPHRGDSHLALGDALARTGRAADALPELEAAMLTHATHPGRVHLARARALVALGRAAEARRAAQEAARADPALAAEATAVLGSAPRGRPAPR